MVTRREAELSKLARDIVGCVVNGKPWRECDPTDLVECLEAFTSAAREALKVKTSYGRRRAVIEVKNGVAVLCWADRGVKVTIKDLDAGRVIVHEPESAKRRRARAARRGGR